MAHGRIGENHYNLSEMAANMEKIKLAENENGFMDAFDQSSIVSVKLQFGASCTCTIVDMAEMSLQIFKDMACRFVQRTIPDHIRTSDLCDRLMMFVHDYSSAYILIPLSSLTQLVNDSLVEIVLTPQQDQATNELIHTFRQDSNIIPKPCEFCGDLIGINKKLLKCHVCKGCYHPKCVLKMPNKCPGSRIRKGSHNSNMASDNGSFSSQEQSFESVDGSPSDRKKSKDETQKMEIKLKSGHILESKAFQRPITCFICKRQLSGIIKYGYECNQCKQVVHDRCQVQAGDVPCPGESLNTSNDFTLSPEPIKSNVFIKTNKCYITTVPEQQSDDSPTTKQEPDVVDQKSDRSENPFNFQRRFTHTRKSQRKPRKVLKEGWMVHYTNRDSMPKYHYWVLDTKKLILFHDEHGSSRYKEIALSAILTVQSVEPHSPSEHSTHGNHCFTIVTTKKDYFVGQFSFPFHMASELFLSRSRLSVMRDVDSKLKAIGKEVADAWDQAIRMAMRPLAEDEACGRFIFSTIPFSSNQGGRISADYQLYAHEVLGDGITGVVYRGIHRHTGREVAVKVIDKLKLGVPFEKSRIRDEAVILGKLNHPNIVMLEAIQETSEKLFYVMERMRGNMLSMIQQSQNGRLPERITKFLTIQILTALEYLHSNDIVHCDLKPENILLSSSADFPQVKLGDFGYARMIAEGSFRHSCVGTPQYMAPETTTGICYNRLVDVWSLGVIIYVALSGTFLFDASGQNFEILFHRELLYPSDFWDSIGNEVKDLIDQMLQIDLWKRFTVDECFHHPWFKDEQLKKDLEWLEGHVGLDYQQSQPATALHYQPCERKPAFDKLLAYRRQEETSEERRERRRRNTTDTLNIDECDMKTQGLQRSTP